MKSKSAEKVKLNSFDDLFGIDETGETVTSVPLSVLHTFKGHPFRVLDDEKMQETVESVKQYGVLMPGIVRPHPEGGYEVIAGHRRWRACELAGLTEMPVIIREMDDDTAVVLMVDTNIQREDILPSEKAKAYRMKYEAMKHQGSKGEKYTADAIGEAAGDSGRTVQRYIRLSELVEELMGYVDENKIPMVVGEKLSYLKAEEQAWVVDAIGNSG
ncbi:ParB/RepB/Spo0J family partition protein, partial [Faecalibaculum rodentium]|uniref:ParB/RepB/Spo0J family partition protein n=1 Tax=Faecalibaculum rodentium TaxID=1702221 RepID=UPI0025B751B7